MVSTYDQMSLNATPTLALVASIVRENILLKFEFKNKATWANLQENKRILK